MSVYGAIIGDIAGSCYERKAIQGNLTKHYQSFHLTPLLPKEGRFTDDTVLTMAIADSLTGGLTFEDSIKQWASAYPDRGYGKMFQKWLTEGGSYESIGNGSAMRVAAIANKYVQDVALALEVAEKSALPTHGSEDGILGAQAQTLSILMAINEEKKESIMDACFELTGWHEYRAFQKSLKKDESLSLESFLHIFSILGSTESVTCRDTVPRSLACYYATNTFEQSIKLAVLLGGDTDTVASMAGAISFNGTRESYIKEKCLSFLDSGIKYTLSNWY